QGIIRFSIVPHRALVALRNPVKAGAISVPNFLPDPPAIMRPNTKDVAVAIAEKNQARWRFDSRPAAQVVLVALRTPKRRRRATTQPVDVHRADAAGNINF